MAVKLTVRGSRGAKGAKGRRVRKTRVLFDELMEGVVAMQQQRETKVTSRS